MSAFLGLLVAAGVALSAPSAPAPATVAGDTFRRHQDAPQGRWPFLVRPYAERRGDHVVEYR